MESTATLRSENNLDLQREIDRLKADLRQIRADLTGFAEDAVRTARTGAAQAKERIEQKAGSAAAQGRQCAEAVEEQVMLHPFMSLAAALTVGLVIGVSLGRKG